jgi:hypothetical protein
MFESGPRVEHPASAPRMSQSVIIRGEAIVSLLERMEQAFSSEVKKGM